MNLKGKVLGLPVAKPENLDPVGVTERWLQGLVSRRKYNVKGPLSLWHIDGSHKLIRYVFSYFSYGYI